MHAAIGLHAGRKRRHENTAAELMPAKYGLAYSNASVHARSEAHLRNETVGNILETVLAKSLHWILYYLKGIIATLHIWLGMTEYDESVPFLRKIAIKLFCTKFLILRHISESTNLRGIARLTIDMAPYSWLVLLESSAVKTGYTVWPEGERRGGSWQSLYRHSHPWHEHRSAWPAVPSAPLIGSLWLRGRLQPGLGSISNTLCRNAATLIFLSISVAY